MKHRKPLLLFGILLSALCNICNGQELEKQFQHVVDSTYQANEDAIGIMIHVESPNKNISWTYAVGYSDKNHTN